MGYGLTVKQTDLLTRWAKGEAKVGERAGGYTVAAYRSVEGSDELSLAYHGQDAGKRVSELLGLFIPNGTAKYPVMNAAGLQYANTHMAWGRRVAPSQERECQRVLQEAGAIPIPFNALTEAGIDPKEVHIVEKGPGETITRMRLVEGKVVNGGWQPEHQKESTEHFTGACLFEAKGQMFLFDIDRREIEHKVFNPFIVKLPQAVQTIQEAYDSLMPQAVKEAIAAGKKVLRQGEWFFIPSQTPPEATNTEALKAVKAPRLMDYGLPLTGEWQEGTTARTWSSNTYPGMSCPFEVEHNPAHAEAITRYNTDRDAWVKATAELTQSQAHRGTLQAGSNRGNSVERTVTRDGQVYVKGTVSHQGREHHDLTLKGWYIAVPNTGITSWQVTGEID